MNSCYGVRAARRQNHCKSIMNSKIQFNSYYQLDNKSAQLGYDKLQIELWDIWLTWLDHNTKFYLKSQENAQQDTMEISDELEYSIPGLAEAGQEPGSQEKGEVNRETKNTFPPVQPFRITEEKES